MRKSIQLAVFYLSLMSVAINLTSCSHKTGAYPDGKSAIFVTMKDLIYGADSVEQAMDVTLPASSAGAAPVVILLHGGSWAQGSKSDFYGSGLDTFFTARGCALINMNYRLYTSYNHVAPLELEDIDLVMDYVRLHAASWRVDPDKVVLFGRSVGAQLALLYACTRNQNRRIKAVIDAFGPTNFTDSSIVADPNLNGNVGALLGGPFASNMQAWHDFSPIFHLDGALPTVIFQGTADNVVYPIQSEMLQDSLLVRQVPNLYFNWVGNGHGWDQQKWMECRDASWAFVQQYL